MANTKITNPELFNLGANNTAATQLPVMTTTQRTAMTGLSIGEMIFNSTTDKVEYFDGTKWYGITYENTSPAALTFDFAMAAGGGAGGRYYYGGGGGAGGYRTSFGTGNLSGRNSAVLNAIDFTTLTDFRVVIGSGGTINPSTNGTYTQIFDHITGLFSHRCEGGGYGAGSTSTGAYAGNGGSGGGIDDYGGQVAAGTGTANQGYSGGSGVSGTFRYAGGGGGAGEPGTASSSTLVLAGKGGNGMQSLITGTSTYYAGGGGGASNAGVSAGGGLGGDGGGGQGAIYSYATPSMSAGTANTGGGGGGGTHSRGSDFYGAPGGSGFVILRYPAAVSLDIGTASASVLNASVAGNSSFKYSIITQSGDCKFLN